MSTGTPSRGIRRVKPASKAGERSSTIANESVARERSGVQSLERAFSILEVVSKHHDGIGLAELAKRVRLHNSTTFHLVKTMVTLGYVRQDRETKRYHLGRMVFALAASSRAEIDLVGLATPVLEELARETGETSHLAIRSGDDVVVAAKVAGTGAFQLIDRAGGLRPAHCTALGKILLAVLPEERFHQFMSDTRLEPRTPKTITDRERFIQEIAQVRQSGIAFDDGEYLSEVRCVAAPVRDFTGQVTAAIGISGPVWRLALPLLHEMSAKVRAAAEQLSSELGAKTFRGSSAE